MKPDAKTIIDNDIFLEMHRYFKRLQQRNRFVDIEPKSSLTLAEAHLLKESITQPDFTQSDYQKLFSLPQSHVSRIIDRLCERGFLDKQADKNDSRVTKIKLTALGQQVVDLSDKITRECYEDFSRLLTKEEKKELTRFFKEIADGYGHPQATLRPSELEYSLHQRRITRCFRLLGKRVFDSEFNSTQWQALSLLANSSTPISANAISAKINLTNGATTAVIKDLLKRKLILSVTNNLDKRSVSISITNIGRDAIAKVEQTAALELKSALRKHSIKQCRIWCEILKKYVIDSDDTVAIPSIRATVKTFDSFEEKVIARSHIITQIVHEGFQQYCPDTIASANNLVIGFESDSKFISIFDMQCDGKEVVITAGYIDSSLPKSNKVEVIKALTKLIAEILPRQKLFCVFEPLKKYFI